MPSAAGRDTHGAKLGVALSASILLLSVDTKHEQNQSMNLLARSDMMQTTRLVYMTVK